MRNKIDYFRDHLAEGNPLEVLRYEGEQVIPTVIGESTLLFNGMEFKAFQSREAAGEAAVQQWIDMANNDPHEFVFLLGSSLVEWTLGRSGGPGTGQARSFQEWLNEVVRLAPEEAFATYDGVEQAGEISAELAQRLGYPPEAEWTPIVLYRRG